MLIEGLIFASYEVQRRAVIGGLGEVYLCQHLALNRVDAVKVLPAHLAHDPRFKRRFLREALSAARMRHPNVASVYAADEADGLLYLAMEHVEGEDLASVLARGGALGPVRTVGLLRSAAEALDAAHRSRLAHRDIRPSTLLVTAQGQPLESITLVGFGVSRLFDEEREGDVLEPLAYAAPEQLARHLVTGACDQYSLACVAFACLTGSAPFPGASAAELVAAHLESAPPAVTALLPELTAAADAVFARALAKEPTDRFASCGAFVEALGQALGVASSLTTLLPRVPVDRQPSGEIAALTRPTPGERLALPAAPAVVAEPTALLVVIPTRPAPPAPPTPPTPAPPTPTPPTPAPAPPVEVAAGLPALVDDDLDFPGPESLFAAVESSADLSQPATDLTVRLGLADPPAVGPALLRLAAGPIAVRAEPDATAGPLRWLLAQVASRHAVGQLCLAAALAPVEEETWLWVNWLGVARPSTPPLTGSHVATTPDAARDLVSRLRTVVAARQAGSGPRRGELAGEADDWEPQVLALIDLRLFDRPPLSSAEWDAAASVGVHVVYFCGPLEAPAATTVDITGARFLVEAAGLRVEGALDVVDGAYVRRLAEILPER